MMRDASGTIARLGGQGHGVMDLADGVRAYVPFALPGERVSVKLGSAKGDGYSAQLVEIESVSSERVEPPCQHFHACGGCNMQHWDIGAYQAWKRAKLVSALQRRDWPADEAERMVAPLITVPPRSRRRAEFVARRVGKHMLIGFHEAESRRVVDIQACEIARPALLAPLPRLRQALLSLLGEGRGLDIRLTDAENGLDALFTGPLRLDGAVRQDLAQLASELGMARLCWRASADAAPEILAQQAAPRIRFGAVEVIMPPGGFLQATAEAEDVMAALATKSLPAADGLKLADLFAGCGAFALRLAAAGHQVIAADADKPAIAALNAAANAQQLASRIKAEVRDLERRPLLGADIKKLDAVLLDPPRAGARVQVAAIAAAARARQAPPLVLMAACDPNSFARDARLLADAGYALEQATPIDQFLWTPHLELMAVFRRK